MKLKTFARRAAAAGAVLAALTLAALPALAAPKVQVSTTNAVADHADILSDETEQYVNDVSIKLSDACGAQIGVYTLDELLGSTTMEGFAYDVFNAWGLGSDDLDNGVLLLLAPNEADGGDYYIMRGDGLESQLSFSTLGSLLDEYMEPYWVNGDYDTGTQKTVQALAEGGDERAKDIFRTIGAYLAHTVPLYEMTYDIRHLIVLGRVASGVGGELIVGECCRILREEYPALAQKVQVMLPDEKFRRVGQSMAAASLPEVPDAV